MWFESEKERKPHSPSNFFSFRLNRRSPIGLPYTVTISATTTAVRYLYGFTVSQWLLGIILSLAELPWPRQFNLFGYCQPLTTGSYYCVPGRITLAPSIQSSYRIGKRITWDCPCKWGGCDHVTVFCFCFKEPYPLLFRSWNDNLVNCLCECVGCDCCESVPDRTPSLDFDRVNTKSHNTVPVSMALVTVTVSLTEPPPLLSSSWNDQNLVRLSLLVRWLGLFRHCTWVEMKEISWDRLCLCVGYDCFDSVPESPLPCYPVLEMIGISWDCLG